jgi:lysyl-tRNA synthetase class 2
MADAVGKENLSKNELKRRLKAEQKAKEKAAKEAAAAQSSLSNDKPKAEAAKKISQEDEESLDPNEYFKIRCKALDTMRSQGVQPYPHKYEVNMSLTDFISRYNNLQAGEVLTDVVHSVAGRVHTKRESGKHLIFYDLRGEGTRLQVMSNMSYFKSQEEYETINERLRRGDIIGCKGHPGKMFDAAKCHLFTNSDLIIRRKNKEGRIINNSPRDHSFDSVPSSSASSSLWFERQGNKVQNEVFRLDSE